jgi:hypothetical protein
MMRLRRRIQAPERFEDEDYDTIAASNATKPAFPRLLKEQTVSFDPHLRSAAFPSLTQAHPQDDEDRMIKDVSELADIDVMDMDRSLDHVFLSAVRRGDRLDTQNPSTTLASSMQDPPVLGRSFLDDAEMSDNEEHEVSFQGSVKAKDAEQRVFLQAQQYQVEGTGANGAQSIQWTQLAPPLQVEIFENICDSLHGHATNDILGLSRNELYDVMKHLRNRNKQIVAEDQGIQELQQAQLRAILRQDHSSSLSIDSWRGHVAYTRRHIPHITTRPDYLVCNQSEVELARMFLDERGIDTCVLGDWVGDKNHVARRIHTQVSQGTESVDGVDLAYTSKIPRQVSRPVKKLICPSLPRNALSEIPNSAGRVIIGRSSLRRKQYQSLPEAGPDTVTAQGYGVGTCAVLPTSPGEDGLRLAGSIMNLRAHGSHLTADYKTAMAAMVKTRGGDFEDLDVPYEDEHERFQKRSPPEAKINPPKPPRDNEYPDAANIISSAGQRAITLKIPRKRLENIQPTSSFDPRPSTIRPHEVPTPPPITSTKNPINNTLKYNKTRPYQLLPTVREPLTEQDQGNLSDFSLKLLEIQHGAGKLYTPPSNLALTLQQPSRHTVTSPKRLKLNPPQKSTFKLPSDDTQLQTPYGSTQLQRNDSTSSQEAPPWSPITQVSSSSRIPSRRESYKNDFQPYKLSSASSSNPAIQPGLANETEIVVPTAPQTPQDSKTSYMRPSIAGNGSPVLPFEYGVQASSSLLPEGHTYQEVKPKILQGQRPSQSSEYPQTLGTVSSNSETLSGGSIIGVSVSAEPLRTYATSLRPDPPNDLQSSQSRRLKEYLAIAVQRTPPLDKKFSIVLPSISPAEQSKVDAILPKYPKKPHTVDKRFDIQLPEPISTNTAASSGKKREEDELQTGGQSSSAKKVGETLVSAKAALQESPETKAVKDSKVRRRTYIKSKMQMQKEAASAAANAALGKAGVVGKKRTAEGQGIDTKSGVPLQAAIHESPQTIAHTEESLTEREYVEKSRPFVARQTFADLINTNIRENLYSAEESPVEPPEVIMSSKQNQFESPDSKAAQSTKKVVTDDESYEEDGTSNVSMGTRKIATPKGKKVAVNRAKAAVQGYQTEMAMRGKSALNDTTSKTKDTPKAKAVDGQGEAGMRKSANHNLDRAVGQQHEGPAPGKKTVTEPEEVSNEGAPPLSKKVALKRKVSSGVEQQCASAKGKKKVPGLAGELDAVTTEGERRTKAFRGNQYLHADGTPRARKESARP